METMNKIFLVTICIVVTITSIALISTGCYSGFLLLIIPFIIVIYLVNKHNNNIMIEKEADKEKEMFNNLSTEEQRNYLERQTLHNEIEYTILVGGDTKKSVGSAVVRGAVGSALLGPVGLIGGAISGKNKSETTFTVIYKDGHREVHTVSNDSSEFQKYASYLR